MDNKLLIAFDSNDTNKIQAILDTTHQDILNLTIREHFLAGKMDATFYSQITHKKGTIITEDNILQLKINQIRFDIFHLQNKGINPLIYTKNNYPINKIWLIPKQLERKIDLKSHTLQKKSSIFSAKRLKKNFMHNRATKPKKTIHKISDYTLLIHQITVYSKNNIISTSKKYYKILNA